MNNAADTVFNELTTALDNDETPVAVKEKEHFVLGADFIQFRSTSWCYDTCGRDTVRYTAVAEDNEFVYFWNLNPIRFVSDEVSGIDFDTPFFKVPVDLADKNNIDDSNWVIPQESEWKSIAAFIISAGVLPEVEFFDELFEYVNP